jgi:uncharacterized protein YecT (DUF1311 family)
MNADNLALACQRIARQDGSTTVFDVQKAWTAFQEAEARRRSERFLRGSMYPIVYCAAAERLTRTRIKELQRWIEEDKMD